MSVVWQLALKQVSFQLRHGNDLMSAESLKGFDVSVWISRKNLYYMWQTRSGSQTDSPGSVVKLW